MINVNDKPCDWSQGMNVYKLFRIMGYKLKKPAVLITINDAVVRRDRWDDFFIPENAEVTVVNLLRGG
ncbi:MAG: sulfur carrier protein ThiS [Spirochaetales bacterium]|nr:sulfur carrier protein ThiS [Spirochaetales bacterium]